MSTLKVDSLVEKTSGNGVHIAGHVIQFEHAISFQTVVINNINYNSGNWVDVPVSVTITPKNTNSKMYISLALNGGNITAGLGIDLQLLRNTTEVFHRTNWNHRGGAAVSNNNNETHVATHLDTPNTTSPITYKFRLTFRTSNTGNFTINNATSGTSGADAGGTSITVMEIAG
jgi:hypothetical protein